MPQHATGTTLSYVYTSDKIMLSINEKSWTITENHPRRREIFELIENTSTTQEYKIDKILSIIDRDIVSDFKSKTGALSIKNGELFYIGKSLNNDKHWVDEYVVERVLEFHQKQIPTSPLMNFIEKLYQNPSENSRKHLYRFLNKNGFAITGDGDFLGYRAVTNEFLDKRTLTFDNRPGNILSMLRENVDPDPSSSCSRGFHVGTMEYALNFANDTDRIILVRVNPADAVAVPTHDSNKLRVCKFEVIREYTRGKPLSKPVYTNEEVKSEELYENETKLVNNNFLSLGRDDLCREAARLGYFLSVNEARFMGKEFVLAAMLNGMNFDEFSNADLRKFSERRGIPKRRSRKDMIRDLRSSQPKL